MLIGCIAGMQNDPSSCTSDAITSIVVDITAVVDTCITQLQAAVQVDITGLDLTDICVAISALVQVMDLYPSLVFFSNQFSRSRSASPSLPFWFRFASLSAHLLLFPSRLAFQPCCMYSISSVMACTDVLQATLFSAWLHASRCTSTSASPSPPRFQL